MVLRVEVLGIVVCHFSHGVRERAVSGLAIGRLARIPQRHRVDVRLLSRTRPRFQPDRLLRRRVRFRLVLRIHLRIDVRAEDERLAPERHRTRRVETGSLRECAGRLGMIESVGEVHPLIDEQLRAVGFRGHRKRMGAEILQPRCEGHSGRRGLIVSGGLLVVLVDRRGCILCGGAADADQGGQGERRHGGR